jgi:transcriptional regulator with XRE-family HTH domain
MEDPALRTDREAIAWWLRRLLRARGLRRELARRIPMAPETLSRLLSPEDPTRASLPTARRVVEALQETLMERGVRLAPEEADLIVACLRDKLRRKNRKALAVRPDLAGDHNLTKSPKTVKAAKMVG